MCLLELSAKSEIEELLLILLLIIKLLYSFVNFNFYLNNFGFSSSVLRPMTSKFYLFFQTIMTFAPYLILWHWYKLRVMKH